MYAILEIAGQQFKVRKDQKLFVHRLAQEEGSKVTFDKVLLLNDGKSTNIGAPAIEGAFAEAKVLQHVKGDKVIVFKKKRRKGYRVKNGHRQAFTEIQIINVAASGGKKAASEKKETPKAAAPKAKTAKKEVSTTAKSKKAGDDLKKIEGIGPKAAEALANAGLDTYAKLAKASAEDIKVILTEASKNLAHLDPETWSKQAEMAADGNWDELKAWQDELNGGKAK